MCGRSCLNHAVMVTAGFRLGDEFDCSQIPIYSRQTRHMAQFEECSQRPRTLIALSLEVETIQDSRYTCCPDSGLFPLYQRENPCLH